MISKNIIKHIRSLELKKNRVKEGLFVAEGPKVVADFMAMASPVQIIATAQWYKTMGVAPRTNDVTVTDDELRKVSFLQHPQQVLATFRIPCPALLSDCALHELCLALDRVQDPGNLGTIIRIADWFGIRHIICSQDTADAYSPKTVQATMGSLAHVNMIYTDLCAWLDQLPKDVPVYVTSLQGESLYAQPLTPHGIIVMGNEGNGVSAEVARRANRSLFIPSYGGQKADSLNVAVATAITCAEFRRANSAKGLE